MINDNNETPNTEPTKPVDTVSEAVNEEVGQNFKETSPVIEDKQPRASQMEWPYYPLFNDPMTVTGQSLKGLSEDDPRNAQFQFYAPRLTMENKVHDVNTEWVQHIKHNERLIGPQKPKLRSNGGNVKGRAAIEMVRRNAGNGGTLTFPLIHSCIMVTMEPAKESKFIDLEFSLQHQATAVGVSTTGLLLNARSGVFSEALIRFALEHVISTNYPTGADELVDTLLDVIDPLDYGTLIWGVMATKFSNGHPWEFRCSSKECDHSRSAMLNFSRMLWINKAALTEKQLSILANNQKSITDDIIKQYRDEFKPTTSRVITLIDGTEIELGTTSLSKYIASAKRWVDDIERSYSKGLSNYASPERRAAYLDAQVQSRRMLKYEHLVREIRIPGDMEGEFNVVDDAETIRDVLIEYSTIDENFSIFESGADAYIEDSTIAVIGYPSQKCSSCGFDGSKEYGNFRSIVPIAIDRLLFMLVQQRNMVMSQMGSV